MTDKKKKTEEKAPEAKAPEKQSLATQEPPGPEPEEKLSLFDLTDLALDYERSPAWANFDDATTEDLVEQIYGEISKKVDNYIHVIKAKEADIDRVKLIQAGAAAFIKTRQNQIERMKEVAHESMKRLGVKKLEGKLPRHSLSIRSGGMRLVIDDMEAIPKKFYALEKVPLNKEIKDRLMARRDLEKKAGAMEVPKDPKSDDAKAYQALLDAAEAHAIPGATLKQGPDGITVKAGK